MSEAKAALRTAFRARRAALGDHEVAAAGAAIWQQLAELIPAGATVATFVPVRGEVGVPASALLAHARPCWPRCTPDGSGRMTFYYAATPPTAPGAYGIPEPAEDISLRVDPARVDVVLVPGVAFDRSGARVGQGGGYYDRFLPAVSTGALRVGICYSWQLIDDVPSLAHDARMTHIVTDTERIYVGRPSAR